MLEFWRKTFWISLLRQEGRKEGTAAPPARVQLNLLELLALAAGENKSTSSAYVLQSSAKEHKRTRSCQCREQFTDTEVVSF